MMNIDELLSLTVEKGASDLHLRVPSPPVIRVDGHLVPLDSYPPASQEYVESIFEHITTPEQRNTFIKEKDIDLVYSISKVARFRVSALQQRGTISLAFRVVPFNAPSVDDLGLPQVCKQFILKPRGLILITGPTGSGKSTTMAAMIRHLNENRGCNVITMEDPIEYIHGNEKCIIAQRDVGDDTGSFHSALIHALRHDPDVLVVGEMRDLDTISTAIRAALTGHLVLATLHTTNASQTIDRIIDMYPSDQQRQMRLQLSEAIEGIISQALLPRIDGGRIAAIEVLIANNAVRNLIREEKTFEIRSVMQLGAKDGMQTLDHALFELVRKKIVSSEDAIAKSSDPDKLMKASQPLSNMNMIWSSGR